MKTIVKIPDEAIKRLQSLEHLDESPFLQRKCFRSAAGGTGPRRRTGNSNSDPTSGKRRETATTATAGPETPFPANSARSAAAPSAGIGLYRRPRELPWLVTPAPSVNQPAAVTPAAASSSSRRARPSTTPATTAGVADGGSGARGGTGSLSRSASLASATGARLHPQQDEQRQGGPEKGTGGKQQTGTRAFTAGAGAGREGPASEEHAMPLSSPSNAGNATSNSYSIGDHPDDPEAERFAAEAAAAAAAEFAASEWARQRRRALACAGSMDVPAGSSSPASAGAGGGSGDTQPESTAFLMVGFGSGSVGEDSLSVGGRGGDGSDSRGSPLRGREKGQARQPEHAADGRGVLPAIQPPHPGFPRKARIANVRAAAWLALVKTVTFAGKSSDALRATSAIPLDGLEAGLLELQPFRFGGCTDGGDLFSSLSSSSSPPPSAASSTTSSSSRSGSEQPQGSGEHGDGQADTAGDYDVDGAGGGGTHGAGQSAGGQREGRTRMGTIARRNDGERKDPEDNAPASPPSSSPPAAPHTEAERTAARPDTSSGGTPPPPDRLSIDQPRLGPPDARDHRRHGWVRGRSSISSSRGARSRRSGCGGGGGGRGRSPTPTATGCWVPPPTRWGGAPIKSAAFWGIWGDGSSALAHAGQNGAGASEGPPSRGSTKSPLGHDGGDWLGEQVPEWGEQDRSQGDNRGGFGSTGEFFRTSDGRSLFAESLGSLSGGGSTKHARQEIRWGEGGGSGERRRGGRHRGFLCLLGEEDCCPSERGAEEARRLGIAARRRRMRIDARSRDGKRRAETLLARERIQRLDEECISRRTDKLEWRANLTKSRGEAAVQVMGDRVKTLLWIVALASRTRNAAKELVDGKRRLALLRNHMALVASAMRVQRAWRIHCREKARPKKRGILDHIRTITSVSSRFLVCKRARVVAMLKLWPEGEAAIKLEMRTGKRTRGEGSWRIPPRRRSSRAEVPHSFVPHGSSHGLMGGGATYGAFSGGFNDDGSAAAAAAAAAVAAAHVPAPWFPPLAQKMESRKNETAHNLFKTQGKLFKHRQASEAAWMSMTPVGRAFQQGHLQTHLQQQEQLHQLRSGSGGEESLGNDRAFSGGGGSLASSRTEDTTGSTAERATAGTAAARTERAARDGSVTQNHEQRHRRKQQHQRRQKRRPRSSHEAMSSPESSEDDDTQGSVSTGIGSLEEVPGASAGAEGGKRGAGKKKKRHSLKTSGQGGRRGSGPGGGGGGGKSKRHVAISAEEGLGSIFDDGGGGGGSPASAAPAAEGHQLSRTTPAASSSAQMHRVFAATSGGLQHPPASHKKAVPVRALTSMQLLAGGGWRARLAEIDKDIDASSLVPLAVKLSTIEAFMRGEMTKHGQLTSRDRASQRVHHEEATLDMAKALLQNSIEDFEDQVEASNRSSENTDLLQFFSGDARSRFIVEVEKRVRAYLEKGGSARRAYPKG